MVAGHTHVRPQRMIFALAEDRELFAFEGEAELRRELEEVDVVGGVYSFFSDDGGALVVVQDPSQHREGWRRFVYGPNTSYALEKAPAEKGQFELFASQVAAAYLNENPHFKSITEVIDFARSRRATSV